MIHAVTIGIDSLVHIVASGSIDRSHSYHNIIPYGLCVHVNGVADHNVHVYTTCCT